MEFLDGSWKKEVSSWDALMREELLNQEAILEGAIHSIRNMGDVAFVIIRKREGLFQTVFVNEEVNFSIHDLKEGMTVKVKGIVNEEMIPDYVILDSRMIAKLPKPIVAATGVDALAHVVECYTSKKATPFSNPYALEGAKLIFDNIREAYNNPDNMEAKNNMMLGAYYGGIAITGSGTTAVHALSYPLGGKFHIAHGVSNAILFAHVMAFNKDGCEPQLAQICDAINPQLAKESESVRAQYVIDQIAEIVRDTNIPTDLNQYGVSMENLDFLVTAGSQQQRLLVNNCKELSLEDIREIYLKVLK